MTAGTPPWSQVPRPGGGGEKMLKVTVGHGQSLDSWLSEQSLSPTPSGDLRCKSMTFITFAAGTEKGHHQEADHRTGLRGVARSSRVWGNRQTPACRLREDTQQSLHRTSGHGPAETRREQARAASAGDQGLGDGARDARSNHFFFSSGCICFASARERLCAILKRIW